MKTVEYSSNNSGGDWWLSDQNWKDLESGGWKVNWVKDDPHRAMPLTNGRWLGALATSASKQFDEPFLSNAVKDWEDIVKMDASSRGCDCCGPPHRFIISERDDLPPGAGYASGPDLALLLDEEDDARLRRLARAAFS